MKYLRYPLFYVYFVVSWVVVFLGVSLLVSIFGGDDPWSAIKIWLVNIAMWLITTLAAYSLADSQMKRRRVRRGFPVGMKLQRDQDAQSDS